VKELRIAAAVTLAASLALNATWAQTTPLGNATFQPAIGQAGKDVIWLPTPDALALKMLETARVTSSDLVYDLGASDGKTAIAAAMKFGACTVGIEFNPKWRIWR
jgi:hypothetical protein